MLVTEKDINIGFYPKTKEYIYDALYYQGDKQGKIRMRFNQEKTNIYFVLPIILSILGLQKYEIVGFIQHQNEEGYISKNANYPKPDEWLKKDKQISS